MLWLEEWNMRSSIFRKIAAAGLAVAVAVIAVFPALAADKRYTIPEIGDMNISLPENFTVIDRRAPDSAAYFKLFGLDYNTVMSQMSANNVYLQAMDNTASLTVTVSMTESDESKGIGSYSNLSSEQLGEIGRNFLSQPEYTACRIDDPGKTVTWLSFDTGVDGVKGYLANTVYDGKSINLSVQRNGADVTEEDKAVFTAAVASVNFGTQNFLQQYWLVIVIIAGTVIALLVLLILIIKTARSLKKENRQDSETDRVPKEFMDMYAHREEEETVAREGDNPAKAKAIPALRQAEEPAGAAGMPFGGSVQPEAPVSADTFVPSEKDKQTEERMEPEIFVQPRRRDIAEMGDPDVPQSKYTDAQLAEMLGEDINADETEAQSSPSAKEPGLRKLWENEESSSEARKLPVEQPDDEDDFFEGAKLVPPEIEETGEIAETLEHARAERVNVSSDDMPEEAEAAKKVPEIEKASAPVAAETFEKEPEQTEAEEEIEEAEQKEISGDGELDELEEYMNDEVLVREEAKANKFRDSNDFFEEAPRKGMGVLNSRDIADVEEYDVLGEEEKRAEQAKRGVSEKPAKSRKDIIKESLIKKNKAKKAKPKKAKTGKDKTKKNGDGFKRFVTGMKNFFVHCGYFITNVKRAIKRRHMMKKRQKAEEERRRRARERAARRRAQERQREQNQRENGGLVQVRSRDDRRPPQNGSRRPSSGGQRRPQTGQRNAQRRPQSGQRKPVSGTQRRPAGSSGRRPPQKRRPPENR